MARLIEIARARGLKVMTGEILRANTGMIDMVQKIGFVMSDVPEAPTVEQATFALR